MAFKSTRRKKKEWKARRQQKRKERQKRKPDNKRNKIKFPNNINICKNEKKIPEVSECIICDNVNKAKSIEHIVSESLGNKHYVVPRNGICDECNNLFSKFEDKALSNSILAFGRTHDYIN